MSLKKIVLPKFNLKFSIIIIPFAIGLAAMEIIFPNSIYIIYAYPAAYIASLFMGVTPLLTDAGEIIIPMGHHFINVIPSCSGYGFSCLLYAICFLYILRIKKNNQRVIYLILTIPLVYMITIITNGCRIIAAYYVNEFSKSLLPSNFQSAVHLGVGVTIFLSVLITLTLILDRRIFHDREC